MKLYETKPNKINWSLMLMFSVITLSLLVNSAYASSLYKIPINVQSNNVRSDYQVRINVTWNSHMQNDFSDIRFYNVLENSQIPYWREDYINSSWATFYFRTDLTGTNSTQAWIYYGNTTPVSTTSNGTATFLFFDDFESGTFNKWDLSTGASINSGTKYQGTYSAWVTGDPLRVSPATSFNKLIFMLNVSYYSTSYNYWMGDTITNNFILGGYNTQSATNYTVYLSAQGTYKTTNQTIVTGAWERVVMLQDTSYAKIYFNDVVIPSYQYGGGSSFDQIRFYVPLGTVTEFYIDNVAGARYQYPEVNSSLGSEIYTPSLSINLYLNGTQGDKYYLNNTIANFTVTSNTTALVNLTSDLTSWITVSQVTPYEIDYKINCSANNSYYNVNAITGNDSFVMTTTSHNVICYEVATTTTTSTTILTTTTSTTTTTVTTTTLANNGTTNINVVFQRSDFTNGYCLDSNTLATNYTDQVFINGTASGVFTLQTKPCDYGCDQKNGVCNPNPLMQIIYIIGFILGFLIFIWVILKIFNIRVF